MYGIYGWIGPAVEGEAAGRTLSGMLEACGGGGTQVPSLRGADVHFGCLGSAEEAAERLHTDADVAVVLSETLLGASGRAVRARQLADLYRVHGRGFLRRVRGPFAVALFDRRERTLLLAVDRIGDRTLYARRHGDGVMFASRLGALRRVPGFEPLLDRQALFDYLYFHVVPAPGTIYAGCEKLLPAELRSFDAYGRRESAFYWRMPYDDDPGVGFDTLRDEFRDLLPRVVERAAGDEGLAVGAFLSGGTDSSTVAGTLARSRREPTRTYSVGFRAEGFDEIEYARIAARHFGTDARELYVTPDDVLASIAPIVAYCDEPFANASIVPAYLCARYAQREGIERLLAGDGGDEIFGGNARYANQWVFELYGKVPAGLRNWLIEPLTLGMPGGDALGPLRKLRSYIRQAKVPLPDRLETYNFLHRTPLTKIFDADFLADVDPAHPLADLRDAYGRADSVSSVNRMMHLDLKITLADNDLRKVNQACGLAGLDVRYPLLDDEMLDFAARVPPQLQVRRTELRWFFKRALADFLPLEIIEKRKHGFGLPVGLWMAEHPPLAELTRDSLAALRRRGILNLAYLDWLEGQHRETHATYYGVMLWVLVMLEQWLEQHGH